jgi:hypothetical protein
MTWPSLTPTYGLGSGARIVGAAAISSPRNKIGSAGRIYAYLKAHNDSYYALNFIQKSIYGPYIIKDGRLVYN